MATLVDGDYTSVINNGTHCLAGSKIDNCASYSAVSAPATCKTCNDNFLLATLVNEDYASVTSDGTHCVADLNIDNCASYPTGSTPAKCKPIACNTTHFLAAISSTVSGFDANN